MKSFLHLSFALLFTFTLSAQVGIGTITPNGALDVTSTTDGLLIPRVALVNTTTVTVTTPIASELVYNITPASGTTDVSPGFYYLNSPTGPWVRLGTDASSGPPPPPDPPTAVAAGWLTVGNDDIVEGTNFLGTTTPVDVTFIRNGDVAGRIGGTNASYGLGALINASPGAQNTAVGVGALRNNTGNNNTAIGEGAGSGSSSGNFNILMGRNANVTTGQRNIVIGTEVNVTNATNSIFIGSSFGGAPAGGTNRIVIGDSAPVPASNSIRIGNTTIGTATTQIAWTTTSDRRWKDNIKDSGLGLDFLQTLRPVSYVRKNDENKKTEYGFIAQELEGALIAAGDKNNAIISKDLEGMYGVRYNDFISITVKAVQEQQVIIEELQKDNEELKAVNAAILKRLEVLEKK
jgi:hypothetical protein